MKKFFDDIKKDIKFKSAGPGKKLTDDGSSKPQAPKAPHRAPRKTPTEGAERAGAAALARIEHQHRPVLKTSQDAIRNQVKRELEAEAAATAASLKNTDVERFSEDAIEASIMMIHTFNKDKEKVKAALDIISKYVENICKNPTEEKYRKIKLSNKVFQEKVSVIEGSREYLQALGFESTTLQVDGKDRTEEFLVLPAQESEALEQLKVHLERLQKGEPVRAKLDRQTQVFRPSKHATHFELPPDFYNLTAEELKREQQLKSEIVERNTMLRTKAMREKDEQRERRKYNYALLRVRLPDENILQGTFLAWERVAALYQFVRDSLENGWQPFELMAPGGQKLKEEEELALNECNLAPAALLTFSWDAAVQADIAAAGGKTAVLLKAALLENIKTLS
uniref:UBX domain-containing protein 6 n=1 Tax=Cyprinus carpio carpio TaxID=630221 RepID=A0A9J7YTQ7_CYPCA